MHRFLLPLLVLASLVVRAHAGDHAPAAPAPAAAAPAPVSADEALARLKKGNDWYVTDGRQGYDIGTARREAVAQKQYPFCSILSCADSRVPPEHIFQAGLGELFTVRVAGNVAEPSTVASLEYAAEHLGTQLIVVMGHERCGAVHAAATATSSLGPNLDSLLGLIKPHIRASDNLDTSIYANTRAQTAALGQSAILSHMLHAGKLKIVAARYDLDTGRVEFLPDVALAQADEAAHAAPADAHAAPADAHAAPADAHAADTTAPKPKAAGSAHAPKPKSTPPSGEHGGHGGHH